MTWHADGATLRDYQAGVLPAARTASVEAHLTGCAACRAELAGGADVARLDRNWSAVTARLEERSVTRVERALVRLGIAEHDARLVVMTPAAQSPSVLVLVALLVIVGVASALDGGTRDGTFYAFVVLAPLLPVAGVAAAFGSGDPAGELTASTPKPAFELLLVRSVAVVAITTLITTVAALPFSGGWQAAAWLLPALGLTAASLALSTWVHAHWAATGLAATWVVAAATSWRANRFDPDVVARFAALRPGGQALFAVVAVAGTAVFLVRRDALDLRRPV